MARADSTVAVAITGDARDLQRALRDGDKALSGFGANAGKLIAAGVAGLGAAQVFDFAQDALGEADRLGDALGRLEGQLGGELARQLQDRSDDFHNLGQSSQDILELAAGFTDTATALGQGADDIAQWADDAAAIAAALALQGVGDAAGNIDAIGKAAGGSERALKTLGVDLDEAAVMARALRDSGKDTPDMLTDSEIAAARYAEILETLAERLGDTTASSGDLEQSQAELQAKWETLTGKIGAGLEGPLNDLLAWILTGIEGWELFGAKLDWIRDELRKTLGPIYAVTDAISGLLGAIGDALAADDQLVADFYARRSRGSGRAPSFGGSSPDERSPSVTVNVNGGDPSEVERAVRRALSGYSDRNGVSFVPD